MSQDTSVEVIIAIYADEASADAAIKSLHEAKRGGLEGIREVALVQRGTNNKLRISEQGDMSSGKGAAIGGTLGAVIGLMAGPVGWLALGGAALGGLFSKLGDTGLSNKRLKELGESIQPGQSAVITIVDQEWVSRIEANLEKSGGKLDKATLNPEAVAALESSRSATYEELAGQGRMDIPPRTPS